MKTYTIIGGVNGVGKSSLTGVLKQQMRDLGIIVDVDDMTAKLGAGVVAGGKAAIRLIDDCIARGINFSQETTLSGVRPEQTVRRAKEQGYTVRLFYIGLDTEDECQKRIANRVEKGGHNIPPEDVARRFTERFEALARVLPYCDDAAFFDNDNGFVQVAEYRNGLIIPIVDNRPRWLRELLAASANQ
ncbi:MAG: zeta toxin family protein [Clostridia bacterium]|nr:zeta toxin family protein [Clostridia bacterium]